MDKRYLIFDFDGTLADSLKYWNELPFEYLKRKGCKDISPGLAGEIQSLTVTETARLFIEEYGVSGSEEEAVSEIYRLMDDHYNDDIPLKKDVPRYLKEQKERGAKMCVASSTSKSRVRRFLRRRGVLSCFDFVLSCEDGFKNKEDPEIFRAAASRFGAPPGEIAVYEDALYAVKTAKNAGFYVIGVYDEEQKGDRAEIDAVADEILDFNRMYSESE